MSNESIEKVRAEAAELLAKLREERDELHVRMHLAGAEIRDEWDKLEPKFEHLQTKAQNVAASVGEASKDIGTALAILGDELRHGYARIRKSLRS